MDITTRQLCDELARLEHKLQAEDGSPEALRRMAARARELRGLIADQPLVVTNGVPDPADLALY